MIYNYRDKLIVHEDHITGPHRDTIYGIVLDITEYKNG